MGMSYAVRKGTQHSAHQPRVPRQDLYEDFHRCTLGMQNADGSFSTEWFVGPGASGIDRRVQTTGHILEWLAFSLPEEELKIGQMNKAVDYLAGILLASPQHDWSIGPLGHALHALAIYDDRLFKAHEQAALADYFAADEKAEQPAAKAVGAKPAPPKTVDVKPVPKTADEKPAPAELVDGPAPKVLDLQPAIKAIADRPAPQGGWAEPAEQPVEQQPVPPAKGTVKTPPPNQADLGAPALLGPRPLRRPTNRRIRRHRQRHPGE